MSAPELPWPETVWTATIEEVGKQLRKAIGDKETTAICGALMRHGWKCHEQALKTLLDEKCEQILECASRNRRNCQHCNSIAMLLEELLK